MRLIPQGLSAMIHCLATSAKRLSSDRVACIFSSRAYVKYVNPLLKGLYPTLSQEFLSVFFSGNRWTRFTKNPGVEKNHPTQQVIRIIPPTTRSLRFFSNSPWSWDHPPSTVKNHGNLRAPPQSQPPKK